ncbi:uncharacterized protein [Periplaneta americana]|uniref:uncharacterized protein isoform X2 n=1 Tax=Periplaneta americana TaxID=6978 RepID=UPI0037E7A50B
MADNRDTGGPLPPGWDRKYDHRTGRFYYINYFNKTTTWEDPRLRYRQLAQPAPQYVPATVSESIPLQDLTNVRPSPMPGRAVGAPGNLYASPARTMETTMTTDTEQSVSKISAMFPTVSDTHIRALLMKYHNREAVVMSALQVEKHPISTPGPYATPPLQGRHFHAPGIGGISALQMTPPLGLRDSPRTGSPIPRPGSGASGSYIGSPRIGDVYRRPHSSPKMKLRYLKSVFPKAEETLLLDILSNSDNNVQKATEKLIAMGFEKRDTPPPRLTLRKKEEEQQKLAQEHRSATPTPPPRMKSLEEKQKMKARLQEKYPDIPERVITIALDSVDFDEERASQILNIMVQEEEKVKTGEPSTAKEKQVIGYLKSVFPKTEDTLLLEILSDCDNNVQKATEKLIAMGFEKCEASTSGMKVTKNEDVLRSVAQEHQSCKREETRPAPQIVPEPEVTQGPSPLHKPASRKASEKQEKDKNRRSKGKKDIPKVSRGTSTTEDKEYKSPYLMKVCGPNRDLYKGPNDELLLVDYVTWNGPNADLLGTGVRSTLAKGPDRSLLQGERSYIPKGPNSDLRKGPMRGLAKGSIYSQLSANSSNESRGK